MIIFKWYESGDIFGMRYDMGPGDKIPMHKHRPETEHNVIVLKGSVLFDQGGDLRVLSIGDAFDFDGSQLHEITALEHGATILNIFLHGMPPGYAELPQSEREGTI